MGAESPSVNKVLNENYNTEFVETLLNVAKEANAAAAK